MKKTIALLLLLCLALCLFAGCAKTEPAPAPTQAPATQAPAPTEAPKPTEAPAPTAEPAPAPAPSADFVLTAAGTEYPAYRFSGDLTGGGGLGFTCLLPAEAVTAEYEHNAWVLRSAAEPGTAFSGNIIATS